MEIVGIVLGIIMLNVIVGVCAYAFGSNNAARKFVKSQAESRANQLAAFKRLADKTTKFAVTARGPKDMSNRLLTEIQNEMSKH